ncbi:uncharacterized protein LOC131937614 isoform X2 [Physella acuta]|uniref:uncharacterized protein LOC131937614 isoform X2 n=1 Tax=Physella acuta TaxID=109671 RepID=UPI0027DD90FC|nr:uncharacterized protein LOC131937614 isoform X2 [Physella acuta]
MSGAQLSFDDHPAIVLDSGSGTCRAGLAGDETPSSLFPSIVGRRKFLLESIDEAYVGTDAQQRRELLHLSYPIEHGIVVNWEDMEKIWDHTFFSDLKLSPEEHPILTSEPPLNPKGNREKTAQVLFETYKTPAAFVALQPMLAKHATGLHQGLMLSVGDGCLHCVPIFMGQVQFQAIRRIDFAGRDLTLYLQRLLFRRGYSFTTNAELDIVRDMKEQLCFVVDSDSADMSIASLKQTYTLPDGSTVKLDHERYLCSELLFKPDGEFHTGKGLVDLIVDSVNDCNVEARKDMYHMISLSGGTTLLPGFKERLRKELRALPPKKYPGMNIWNAPERQFHVWIGGSITASLRSMEHAWVSRQDYDEYGPHIVNIRCYGE